jgi:serine/threonine protein kinase
MSFSREPNFEPLPGYRLIAPLGHGGFGEVWKCEAPGGLYKAIKFVYGNLNSLDIEGVRAEQELKALQRVKEVRHPFVLSTERIEIVEGELVIVMELADKSLHDSYTECQAAGMVGIPRDALLRFIRDAAEALDHMNEKHNLQHLDIKPRNLFVVSDRVKVADFGLVKHLERQTGSGILGGVTPLYAPPETLSGKISASSDQYSLAIVYQELLTGHRPFDGKNIRQLAHQHLNEEPDLRSLPEGERPVVARALAKDPAKRFPNCLSFVRALYSARAPARLEKTAHSLVVDASRTNGKTHAPTDSMQDLHMEFLDAESPPEPPPALDEIEVSQLGVTVAQPQTGALRPTILIGVGAFGRRALLELRCRFLDRFGDLRKIPLLRFVYIDTDPEAVQAAARGAAEVALAPSEIYHLALQPIVHYRRRQLEQLVDWLPREKLYNLPRSLKTQGSRALGRLAFADNHLRLLTRLRHEVQRATHPDALYQAVNQTGLALRDNVPRVYVVGAAGGGNSGCLVDLGYALRRMLQQLRHNDAPITTMLFCGAPEDPATPVQELANVYATLTEVNHFADPAIPFGAQYSPDGPRIADTGQPFDSAYLLALPHRNPEALRDAVAHLGSYLFHELTTPLGLRLDQARIQHASVGTTPFRSFGTYGVWFPRGLLLHLAARQACRRIMEDWQTAGAATALNEIEAACARALAEPELRTDTLAARIEEAASNPLDGSPAEALTRMLASLEEQSQQSVALEDPGNWARQALTRVRDMLGTGFGGGQDGAEWRKSKLNRALGQAAQQVAEAQSQRLAEAAYGLMEIPGRRVAAAEAALQQFRQFCDETCHAYRARLEQQAQRTQKTWDQLQTALAACLAGNGGFSLFGGGRGRRSLRVFVDYLAAFARQCLAEDVGSAVKHVFVTLGGMMEDRLRDLSFCRQRLRHLQETLDAPSTESEELELAPLNADRTPGHSPITSTESYWEAIRQSATARVVLPNGEADLERAALRFLASLKTEQWMQLDQALQDNVLAPSGGLHGVCMTSSDLTRHLAAPLLEQAAACLSDHLPITDVAQVELAAAEESNADIGEQMKEYFANSAPLLRGKDDDEQVSFLLIPASDAGKQYGEEAKRVLPHVQLVKVPGQADLTFCREQDYLSALDLHRILRTCRAAYADSATAPTSSPHARFDIADWIPLHP